jgi:carbonic anhydrase
MNAPEARKELVESQAPFAAIIRCADSRVAPEIVFDQPLGELFVCGVAGNIIVVMGHSDCGAVGAAIKHRNDSIEALPRITPSTHRSDHRAMRPRRR